jgi:hypothetical protein
VIKAKTENEILFPSVASSKHLHVALR